MIKTDLNNDLQAGVFSEWITKYSERIARKELVLGVETMDSMTSSQGLDGVLYDISDLDVSTYDEFKKYIDENGYDEESFEVDRCTLLRIED